MSMYDERIAKLKKQQNKNSQPVKTSQAGSMYDERIAAIKASENPSAKTNADIVSSFSAKYRENQQKRTENAKRFQEERQEFKSRHGSNIDLMKFDLDAGQKEIDKLEAELARLRTEKNAKASGVNSRPYAAGQAEVAKYTTGYGINNNRPYAAGLQAQQNIEAEDDPIRELEQLISQKKQYRNQAKHYQEKIAYEDTVKNADFDMYDDYAESDDDQYNWINDAQFRNDYEARFQRNGTQSKYGFNHYDRMNASEIAIYNYYYAKSGKEAAQKYLDNIQETLNTREAEEMYGQIEGNTAAELVFGISVGVNEFGTNVTNVFNTKDDYIPQSAYQIAGKMADEGLADASIPLWYNIKEGKWEDKVLGRSLGQIAYDAVTTTANMAPSILVGIATGGTAGTALMGLSAAGGAYQQALNEGFDKDQARGYSFMVGASEAVLEKLLGGISAVGGNVLGRNAVKNIANADTAFKAIAKRIGSSMLSEFSEEYLQEVLDPVFRNAMLKTGEDVKLISAEALYSGILGALTGAFMEAPSAIYGESQTTKTGRKLREAGSVDSLAKIGNTFAPETVAYKLAGKVNENTGAYTIGQLFNEVNAKLTEQNISEITEALVKEGVGEITARQYAKAFAYVVEGGVMPDRMVNAIEADAVLAKAARTVLIDSNTTWNQRTQGYQDVLKKLAEDKVKGKTVVTGKANDATADTVDTETENSAQDNAESPKYGNIQSIKNGKVTVKMDDGSEVDLKDADLDPEDSVRIETIASIDGISAEDASGIFNILKAGSKNAQYDAIGAIEAYRYGYYGLTEKQLDENGTFSKSLTPEQRKAVYEMGQKARQQKVENTTFRKTDAKNVPGKVHYDGDRTVLNERQQVSLKAMDRIASALGVQIYIFESKVGKNGKRIGENGWYDPKDGSIHIDLYAGQDGGATMLFTLAHELTHYIRQWSPQKFKILADFLMEEYGKKGANVNSLIREQQNKAKRNGRTISYDTAYEEVVADSMEMMLSDGNVMNRLEKLKAQDKDLWSQIKRFIDDMAAKIRAVYKDLKPDSKEAEFVMEMGDTIYRLQELFTEGLVEASENFQTAEKNTTEDGGAKYSFKGYAEDGKGVYESNFPKGTPKKAKGERILRYIQDVWSKKPIKLRIEDDKGPRYIEAQFDPTFSEDKNVKTDASKLMGGNRHGSSMEQRVTLDLADDYYQIASDAEYNYSKDETGKTSDPHLNVKQWHYFVNDIYFAEQESDELTAYRVSINVKEKDSGHFFYSFSAEKAEGTSTQRTLHAAVNSSDNATANGSSYKSSIRNPNPEVKKKLSDRDSAMLDRDYMDAVKRGDMKTAQRMVDEAAKQWGAFLNNADANEVFKQSGEVRTFYHGTNTGDFTVFDKSLLGNSSGDMGWFGKGFYFAFSSREAATYGGRVINAYLKMRKPYDYSQLYKFKGSDYVSDKYSRLAWLYNIVKQFPDIVSGQKVYAYPNDADEGTAVSWKQLAGWMDRIEREAEFSVEQVETPYGDTAWELRANPKVESFTNDDGETFTWTEYGMRQMFANERDAKEPINQIGAYLSNVMGVETIPRRSIEKIDFSGAVQRAGYDGIIQSPSGDEAVVFDSSQIKSSDPVTYDDNGNVIPLSERFNKKNPDIRYSDRDTKATTDRDLLSGTDVATIKNEVARKKLTDYQKTLEAMNAEDQKLREIRTEIKELSFAKGPRDTKKLKDLKFEAIKINNHISVYEGQIQRMEKELQSVVKRERAKVVKEAEKMDKEVLAKEWMDAQVKQSETLREYRETRAALRQQESDTAVMEKEFVRIVKEFEKLEQKSGKTISDLRTKLKNEAKSHRADEKMWMAEFGRLMREYDAAGRNIDRLEQKIERQRASAKERVENRNKTAMRHKIQNVVKELNSLLLANDKKRHVPDNLKKPVEEALKLLNMDTVDAENRAAKYADMIAREQAKANPDQDKIDAYTVTMENILRQGEKMGQRIKELHAAYEEIQNSDDPDIANAYDPVIAGAIKELSATIGNTSIKNMSMEQLSDVYDVYRMVLTRVRDANKAIAENIRASIEELAKSTIREVQTVGGSKKYRLAALDSVRKFDWNNLKPVYAMERIGSSTLTNVFNNVRAGEDVWAKDVAEARAYYLEKSKKYGYDKWDFDKKYRFESNSGIPFELTLEQMMSLYAYSKREQAADHLRLGGFVFDSNIGTYKEKDGKKSILKYKVNTADAHQITPEIMADIIGKLSKEQAGFVDEMQDYLSTVMGAKGNEVTSKMYGVKLFKEKFYFPLKSAKQFMFEQNEVSGEVRIKNSGFTNKVVANANNPVILSNFMDVWSGHVNDMSMYHAFTLPLEDFNRVFNYNSPKKDGMESVSVKGTIQNAYGPAAEEYLRQLITDLNGGARTDPRTGIINKLTALHKKGAVLASLSVVIQQPSAIARATALVDLKYFDGYSVGTLPKVALDFAKQSLHDVFNPKKETNHDKEWAELKKYAPVAIIKEMGYFDANMGKSTQNYITGKEYSEFKEKVKAVVTDSAYRDEILSKAPSLADEVAWCAIWRAVKRETFHRHNNLRPSSDALMKLAGERFTEVITKTQVYDSVLARSANMRSKDTGMNMATSFMAEPTTAINMLLDARLKGKRGNKIYKVRTNAAVLSSIILNSMLVSIVYAGRDDDEEETYSEKYLGALTRALIDGINPAMYFPFIKDIWSIIQGYDVERSDMALANDLLKAWKKLSREDVSPYQKAQDFAGTAAMFLGIPLKNIMRDFRWIWQMLVDPILGNDGKTEETTLAGIKYAQHYGRTGKDTPNKAQLYEARLAGDDQHAARVAARYDDEDSANAAVRAAIKDSFTEGKIDEATALKHMVQYAGMDGSEAHWTMDAWKYRLAKGSDEGYGKYDKFYDAVRSGKNLQEVVKEYTDYGVKNSTLTGQITEEFKPVYLEATDSERSSMKAKLISAYVACGMERENVEENLEDWDFEAEYGFAYSKRKEAYLNGDVSEEMLVRILMDHGYTNEDARHQIEAYEWEADGAEGATTAAIREYNENCAAYNVPKDIYLKIRKFSNDTENDVDKTTGKTIYYSAMKKVMAEIDRQNLTDAQKTAIARSLGWSEKNIQKYKLW